MEGPKVSEELAAYIFRAEEVFLYLKTAAENSGTTRLHGVASKKTAVLRVTAVRTQRSRTGKICTAVSEIIFVFVVVI
jgi:hypothetical protein